jgi:PPOX class probable F420-dependent enzyme
MSIPASLRTLIESGPLAHVVTVNPDGSPQLTVIWIGLDGDDIVSGHMNLSKKLRNVRTDDRVVISLEAPRQPGTFLAEYAVITGRGEVVEGGAPDVLNRLGKVYVAPDFEFPPAEGDGYVLRTRVERVSGHGPWAQAD